MTSSARRRAATFLLISIKGEQVCLRRLPDTSGRVLLDCAIGLRGDDDQFYGLRAADPARITEFPQMNARVRVIGKLIPQGSGTYEEAGQIVYATIEPIGGEPKPVEGTFMCLAPSASGATPVDKCRNVIKTDRALYWGLDMPSLDAIPAARRLTSGDRSGSDGLGHTPWNPAKRKYDGLGRIRRPGCECRRCRYVVRVPRR